MQSSYGGTSVEDWISRETLGDGKSGPCPGPIMGTMGLPTQQYNAQIRPLMNMNIKGVIWYQGESNKGQNELYSCRFGRLMSEWRRSLAHTHAHTHTHSLTHTHTQTLSLAPSLPHPPSPPPSFCLPLYLSYYLLSTTPSPAIALSWLLSPPSLSASLPCLLRGNANSFRLILLGGLVADLFVAASFLFLCHSAAKPFGTTEQPFSNPKVRTASAWIPVGSWTCLLPQNRGDFMPWQETRGGWFIDLQPPTTSPVMGSSIRQVGANGGWVPRGQSRSISLH